MNFNNEANVADIFGIEKHSKKVLTEDEQAAFSDWNWVADDQNLPAPSQTPSNGKGKKRR